MSTMALQDLEDIYDELADAIDRVGADAESTFLAKLALSLAHHLGDRALVSKLIAECAEPVKDVPSPDTLTI